MEFEMTEKLHFCLYLLNETPVSKQKFFQEQARV